VAEELDPDGTVGRDVIEARAGAMCDDTSESRLSGSVISAMAGGGAASDESAQVRGLWLDRRGGGEPLAGVDDGPVGPGRADALRCATGCEAKSSRSSSTLASPIVRRRSSTNWAIIDSSLRIRKNSL
jgi:hypothetical protein